MICLAQAVDDYLGLRRSLGFKLECHPRLLADFVGYLQDAGATTLTTVLAVSWACQPPDCDPAWWSRRLGIVRVNLRPPTTPLRRPARRRSRGRQRERARA